MNRKLALSILVSAAAVGLWDVADARIQKP